MSDNPLEILGTYDIENETRDLQITCLNGTAESFVAHIGATSDPYVASLPMVFANNNFTMERAEAIAKELDLPLDNHINHKIYIYRAGDNTAQTWQEAAIEMANKLSAKSISFGWNTGLVNIGDDRGSDPEKVKNQILEFENAGYSVPDYCAKFSKKEAIYETAKQVPRRRVIIGINDCNEEKRACGKCARCQDFIEAMCAIERTQYSNFDIDHVFDKFPNLNHDSLADILWRNV